MTTPIIRHISALRTVVSAALLAEFASGIAHAHPGHILREASVSHLLTSPYHLAMLAISGATFWFSARWVERRLPRRLLQVCGVAAVTTAAVLSVIRV